MFLKNKNTPEVGQDRDLRKKNKTCLTMTFNKDVVIKTDIVAGIDKRPVARNRKLRTKSGYI